MTIQSRIKPCEVCGYPITELHHMAEQKKFGKNDITARLCANCHELFHLIKNKVDVEELGRIVVAFGGLDDRLIKIKQLVGESITIEHEIYKKAGK